MKRASDAQRGAEAESEVAVLLHPLEYRGWQIEYNLRIRKWGDADVVLRSPKGNWYVVDVKSHGGTKVYESGRLRKRYGRNTYDFAEGDLIYKVKGQAKEVKSLKGAVVILTFGDIVTNYHRCVTRQVLISLRGFQIKKSPLISCGVGVLDRLQYGTGKDAHPTIAG